MKKMMFINLLKRGHGLRRAEGEPGSEPTETDTPDSGKTVSDTARRNLRVPVLALALLVVGVAGWLYFGPEEAPAPPGPSARNSAAVTPSARTPETTAIPAIGISEAAQAQPEKGASSESIERIPIEPLPPEKPSVIPSSPPPRTVKRKGSRERTSGKKRVVSGVVHGKPERKLKARSAGRTGRAVPRLQRQETYQVDVASCVTAGCMRRTEDRIRRAGFRFIRRRVNGRAEMYLVVNGGLLSPLAATRHQRLMEREGIKVSLYPVEDGKQVVAAGRFERLQDARSFRAQLHGRGGRWRVIHRSIPVAMVKFIVEGLQSYRQATEAKAHLFRSGFQPLIRKVGR